MGKDALYDVHSIVKVEAFRPFPYNISPVFETAEAQFSRVQRVQHPTKVNDIHRKSSISPSHVPTPVSLLSYASKDVHMSERLMSTFWPGHYACDDQRDGSRPNNRETGADGRTLDGATFPTTYIALQHDNAAVTASKCECRHLRQWLASDFHHGFKHRVGPFLFVVPDEYSENL